MFLLSPNLYPITTALTKQLAGPIFKNLNPGPFNVTLQAEFVYGSGGTTADAYVQTSLDGGASFFDVANFHFTTSSAKAAFNLSSLTPVTTQLTTFDNGSLASNTAVDGILGDQWQVILTTTGTYGGTTTISVYLNGLRLTH
jgi:hypothetical protein